MKRRPPPRPPPIVVTKGTKRGALPPTAAGARRPLPPDGRIQAKRYDDPDFAEQERIGRLSATQRWEEAYTQLEKRLERPNDLDLVRDTAQVVVDHRMVGATMNNWVAVEGELPHLRNLPAPGRAQGALGAPEAGLGEALSHHQVGRERRARARAAVEVELGSFHARLKRKKKD